MKTPNLHQPAAGATWQTEEDGSPAMKAQITRTGRPGSDETLHFVAILLFQRFQEYWGTFSLM